MADLTFPERLRLLADWMDAHPDVPVPYSVSTSLVHWFPADASEAVAVTKAFGTADKSKESSSIGIQKRDKLAGFTFHASVWHDRVCTRRVVTETVVEKVAVNLPAVIEYEEREVTRERTVWDCPESLLDPKREAVTA